MNFSATVLPHHAELKRRARMLTACDADADDLTQDALLRAYRHWHTFEERGHGVRAWLLTVLRSEFLNQCHSRKLRERKHTALADATEGAQDTEMLEAIDRDLPDEVRQALDEMIPQFRSVVERVDLCGDEYAEAADNLGIKRGTVMSRLSRGRKFLRGRLHEYAAAIGAIAS